MTKATIIKWTEIHTVNIPTFDKHHHRLFEILNDFYNEVNSGAKNQELLKVINDFYEYAKFHFQFEENIMKRHKYPAFAYHKEQHDNFLAEIIDFEKRFKNGKLLLTVEITQYIKAWIEFHMDKTDRLYSDFLLERGVR